MQSNIDSEREADGHSAALESLIDDLPAARIARRSNGLPTILGLPAVRRRTTALVGRSPYADKLRPVLAQRTKLVDFAGSPEVEGDDALRALISEARRGVLELVYIAAEDPRAAWVVRLIRALGDTTASIYLVASPSLCPFDGELWSAIGETPTLCVAEDPMLGFRRVAKRCEDLLLSSALLALLAPLLTAIGFAIKLTSPGPIFFRQRRYGHNGEEIRVLKFRTMTVMDDSPNVTQATRNDARLSPVGGFLRRTNMDELPQLLDVVVGTMSLVGPRPHAITHNEQYRSLISGFMRRHKVKPGITGWAQVNGWRGETDTLEKMKMRVSYDLEYIRNWSIIFDLRILLRTRPRNAY